MLTVLLLLLVLVLLEASAAAAQAPNIVLLLTDDQDTRLGLDAAYTQLGSVEAMPYAMQYFVRQGLHLRNGMVATTICCPSRTESFSGRYYHNIGPPRQSGDCMLVNTTNVVAPGVGLFPLMQDAGYITGVFGKVTNDQENVFDLAVKYKTMDYIDSPLAYNDFNCPTYFRRFPNGTSYIETLKAGAPVFNTTYQTAQIGNRTLRWLDQVLPGGGQKPVFLYLGPHAPHFPAEPAPWYAHLWDNASAPLLPNYNLTGPDKPRHIRQNPGFTAEVKCWEDQHFRDRWASLKSVDELLEAVVAKFEQHGQLNNTFFFFTSDHGYKLGSWRVGTSKQHPYETDIHVPFYIRGPGVPQGLARDEIVSNVDLLPTFLELAGRPVPPEVDGRSFVFLLRNQTPTHWRHHILIEYKSIGTYYNDHASIWQDGNQTAKRCGCPGPPRSPKPVDNCVESNVTGQGNCYFIDSELSNNWRALRIMNDAENVTYVEYDPKWTFEGTGPEGLGLQWYELYDLNTDPYQLDNMYSRAAAADKQRYHQLAAAFWTCRGSSCP